MKTQVLKTVIGFCIIILYAGINSFTKSPSKSQRGDWGEWANDDCFKGIDYRVKKGSYNSYSNKWDWYVQFRNRYNNSISFSYSISEPGTMTDPDHRQHVSSGSIGETIGSIFNAGRCHVRIGRLRFGDDDSGSYVPCDQ